MTETLQCECGMQKESKLESLSSFRLLNLILSEAQANRFRALAKKYSLRYGIVLMCQGSLNARGLSILGIRTERRYLIKALLQEDHADDLLEEISKRLKLSRAGNGIAFITSVQATAYWARQKSSEPPQGEAVKAESGAPPVEEKIPEGKGRDMYQKLTIIVNRGQANEVMDIARKHGARGGTILHGRGTGAEHAARLFGIEIEPEKELIMILLPEAITDRVMEALSQELKLDNPGHGILFLEPVLEVKGLVDVKENGNADH